jgi:hypothetical protein
VPGFAYRTWQRGSEGHWQVVLDARLRGGRNQRGGSHGGHDAGARDVDAQEFADDNAAIQEARAVARDLSQERIVVTNEKGDVVHEEPLFRA